VKNLISPSLLRYKEIEAPIKGGLKEEGMVQHRLSLGIASGL
jgi:hypothetical protein